MIFEMQDKWQARAAGGGGSELNVFQLPDTEGYKFIY